jgi:hypothetical protein
MADGAGVALVRGVVRGGNRVTAKTDTPPEWGELLEASDALVSLLSEGIYGIDIVVATNDTPITQEEGAYIASILTRLDNAIKALKHND